MVGALAALSLGLATLSEMFSEVAAHKPGSLAGALGDVEAMLVDGDAWGLTRAFFEHAKWEEGRDRYTYIRWTVDKPAVVIDAHPWGSNFGVTIYRKDTTTPENRISQSNVEYKAIGLPYLDDRDHDDLPEVYSQISVIMVHNAMLGWIRHEADRTLELELIAPFMSIWKAAPQDELGYFLSYRGVRNPDWEERQSKDGIEAATEAARFFMIDPDTAYERDAARVLGRR